MLEKKLYIFTWENIVFLYKCLFLLYTIFTTTEFSRIQRFTSLKMYIFGFGLMLLLYSICKTKGKIFLKNKLLFIFMIFNTLTLIFNDGIQENFKFYLITVIQLFVLTILGYDCDRNTKKIKKEFKIINFIFISITFILTGMSTLMYIDKSYVTNFLITDPIRTDLIKGVYVISTSAGLMCYLSIAASFIALIILNKKSKLYKLFFAFYMLNIILQCYVLFLTKARGAMVSLIAFFIILSYLFISSKKIRMRIIYLIAIIILFSPFYMGKISNMDFLNKNVDGSFFNGRAILWENGYNYTFKNYKILGVGAGNLIQVTKELAQTPLPGINGGRLHNIYLDVLCSNGILGFTIFILFLAISAFKMYRYSFMTKIDKEDKIYIRVMFAFLASIAVINIVESIMIYVLSAASALFWIYISYAREIINRQSNYIK